MSGEPAPAPAAAAAAKAPAAPEPSAAEPGALALVGGAAPGMYVGAADPPAQALRRPRPVSAPGVAALQRSAGNQAIAAVRTRPPTVQRQPPTAPAGRDPGLDLAIKTHDALNIIAVKDFSGASVDERVTMSRWVIAGGYYDPQGAANAVDRIWSSFGADLASVAAGHLDAWKEAVHFHPPLRQKPAVADARAAFARDCRALVDRNMQDNANYIEDRRKELGLSGDSPMSKEQQTQVRRSIQSMAWSAGQLRADQFKLRDVHVGYTKGDISCRPVKFNPAEPPPQRHGFLFDPPPKAKWEDVKEQWQEAENKLAETTEKYPELYEAAQEDETGAALTNLSRITPEAYNAYAGGLLDTLKKRLADVTADINGGKLNVLAFKPVHQRMFAGATGLSRDWGEPFSHWAGDDVVAEHEAEVPAWVVVLKTVELTALLVAPLTGGASAIVAGAAAAGAAALEAGIAAIDAKRINAAAKATPMKGTALVTQAQVDQANIDAEAKAFAAVVALILAGVAAGEAGLQALAKARLQALIGDEALAGRLGAAVKDVPTLTRLVRKAEDPAELERLLARVGNDAAKAEEILDARALFRDRFAKRFAEDIDAVRKIKAGTPELAGVADEELVALRGYTKTDYKVINKSLRGETSEAVQKDLEPYVTTAKSGMEAFPQYRGLVLRGESGTAALYKQGETYTTKAFWSTSKTTMFREDVTLKIMSKTGRDIAAVSNVPSEAEVLFPPGTAFKVTKVTPRGPYTTVELTEL